MTDEELRERPSTRSKLEELQVLMLETLAIESRVVGEPPAGAESTEATELILDALESSLDRVLCQVREIRDRLLRSV